MIAIADKASAIVNAGESEGRSLTENESRQVDELHREFESTQNELRAIESAGAMTSALSATAGRISLPDDVVQARNREHAAGRHPGPVAARAGLLLANRSNVAASLFGQSSDAFRGQEDSYLRASVAGVAHPLMNLTGTESSGADGGFAVPPRFFAGILDQAMQTAEFAPRCRLFPTATSGITIPMPNTQDRSTDIAGLNGNRAGENSQQTAQRLKWRNVDVRLHKLFILAEASGELASDGLNFAQQLETKMAEAAAYSLDRAILVGTGVGQPLGILHDPSAIQVAPESGQTADTINFQNIVNMFGRLAPSSQKRATWFVSPGTFSQLLIMTFPGSTQPILLGNGSQSNAGAFEFVGSILGRPVVVSEVCNPLGDAGDCVLADMTQYALPMRSNARIELDRSHGFDRDVLAWRLIWRVSGSGMWNSAISPYAGGATLGWCSYLTAR